MCLKGCFGFGKSKKRNHKKSNIVGEQCLSSFIDKSVKGAFINEIGQTLFAKSSAKGDLESRNSTPEPEVRISKIISSKISSFFGRNSTPEPEVRSSKKSLSSQISSFFGRKSNPQPVIRIWEREKSKRPKSFFRNPDIQISEQDCLTNPFQRSSFEKDYLNYFAPTWDYLYTKDIVPEVPEYKFIPAVMPTEKVSSNPFKPIIRQSIGDYIVTNNVLGEGTFGIVKTGFHKLTKCRVAIKIVRKDHPHCTIEEIHHEGKVLKMLNHPNIYRMYEELKTVDNYYLVTELCSRGQIEARFPLTESRTRDLLRQLIPAVDYLHKLGIIHRDIKLDNILLDKAWTLKLIDLGGAEIIGQKQSAFGTLFYMAPEMLAKEKYTYKVDVWSIGALMYRLLAGDGNFPFGNCNTPKSRYRRLVESYQINLDPLNNWSQDCASLVFSLLTPSPVKRLELVDAMNHEWFNTGCMSTPPTLPTENVPICLNADILEFMVREFFFHWDDIWWNVENRLPSRELATYLLLENGVKDENNYSGVKITGNL